MTMLALVELPQIKIYITVITFAYTSELLLSNYDSILFYFMNDLHELLD